MPNDHPHPPERNLADQVARRRAVASAGHTGDEATARGALGDLDASVRATALRALARMGAVTVGDIASAAGDPVAAVRRAAATVIARAPAPGGTANDDEAAAAVDGVLAVLLADDDATVTEVAAWATGEHLGRDTESGHPVRTPALVDTLAHLATDHDDALCREAAVAALGAIGDQRGLPAILRATHDKATVRRRAVIALAPFDGPEVDQALARAQEDRDWQVRQAAEDQLEITHGHETP